MKNPNDPDEPVKPDQQPSEENQTDNLPPEAKAIVQAVQSLLGDGYKIVDIHNFSLPGAPTIPQEGVEIPAWVRQVLENFRVAATPPTLAIGIADKTKFVIQHSAYKKDIATTLVLLDIAHQILAKQLGKELYGDLPVQQWPEEFRARLASIRALAKAWRCDEKHSIVEIDK